MIAEALESGFDLLQKEISIAGRPASSPLFSDELAEIRGQAFAVL